jgi:integrase
MSVYKPQKSKTFHFDFQFKGNRYHGSTGCTTRRDAERFEADYRRKVALGEQAKPTITVEEACNTWQEMVGDLLASKATTLYQLGYLITGLGARTMLHDLTFKAIQDYTAKRRSLVSDSSVNREVQLLRRVVRWTEPRGFEVPEIAWGKLQFDEPKERVRELRPAEQERLFNALPDNLKPLVEFAILSGQRKAEIVSLRWADVDLIGGRATVQVKGGDKHTFPLSPRMVAILKEQPVICPQVFTYVCLRPAPKRKDRPARVKGERYPFSKQGWNRQWLKALKDAGIEDYRFHDNRHTAATRNLRATGNLKAVSKLLGHSNTATTARYAHALEDDVRAMLSATESRIIPEPVAEALENQGRSVA